jgi:hypothetical protein
MIYIRASIEEDIPNILENLRDSDVEECLITGSSPEENLQTGLKSKLCFTGIINGSPEFMFGTTRHSDSIGVAWLLGTDKIDENKRDFITTTPLMWKLISGSYSYLTNFIPSSNKKSIRWIESSGGMFKEEVEVKGKMMKQFVYEVPVTDSNRYAGGYIPSKESY